MYFLLVQNSTVRCFLVFLAKILYCTIHTTWSFKRKRKDLEAHVRVALHDISIWLWLTWQLVDKGVSLTVSLGPLVLIFNFPAVTWGLMDPWGPVAVNQPQLLRTKFRSLTHQRKHVQFRLRSIKRVTGWIVSMVKFMIVFVVLLESVSISFSGSLPLFTELMSCCRRLQMNSVEVRLPELVRDCLYPDDQSNSYWILICP